MFSFLPKSPKMTLGSPLQTWSSSSRPSQSLSRPSHTSAWVAAPDSSHSVVVAVAHTHSPLAQSSASPPSQPLPTRNGSSTSPSQSLSSPSQLTSSPASYVGMSARSGAVHPSAPSQTCTWPAHTPLLSVNFGATRSSSTWPSQSLSSPSQAFSTSWKPSIFVMFGCIHPLAPRHTCTAPAHTPRLLAAGGATSSSSTWPSQSLSSPSQLSSTAS